MTSQTSGPVPSYEQAVSAWAEHLRSGGTTTWSTWRTTAPSDVTAAAIRHPLPDATHLELVRLLNVTAARHPELAAGIDLARLADRVLTTASPGRGLLDVPLPWPPAPKVFGTPAVEPDEMPDDELIRLAVGVLAHLLPAEHPAPTSHVHARWAMPWRRRFRLHGAPQTVAALRAHLRASGLVESDWRPTHVVIALPVDLMMAEHWAASVRRGSALKWSTVWRRAQAKDRLPRPIDVARVGESLEGRRREPVHVVIGRDPEQAMTLAAEVLGAPAPPKQGTPAAALPDLLRRVNRLTALTHGPDQVEGLATMLADWLADLDPQDGSAPSTPVGAREWARSVAAAGGTRLQRAGYPVHGDPGALAPTEQHTARRVDRQHTLELALMACLRTWHLGGGS